MAAQMKDEKQILSNVIQEIKKKAKKKVDKKRIATLLTARHGLSSDEVEAMLTRLEAEGFINQKLDEKGDLCYAISKPAPFESENSKLEDTVSPRILNVGASKEGDTAEPFPNPLPPTETLIMLWFSALWRHLPEALTAPTNCFIRKEPSVKQYCKKILS